MSDESAGEHPTADDTSPGPAASEGHDELPEDLDVTAYVGPYTFPDIKRRRIPGAIYALAGLACIAWWLLEGNRGLLLAGVLLAVVAVYHFATAWPLHIDQTQALVIATRAVGFPVGHASAQLAWRGLRSRPVWRILVYSAETPPDTRGLVELDAVEGGVLGTYTEANPEDWSDLEG